MAMRNHFLKQELLEKIKTDPSVLHFLDVNTSNGIWYRSLEPEGGIWMSRQFWETFGYNPEEESTRYEDWVKMIHPEDLSILDSKLEKHLSDSRSKGYEQVIRYLHKDGRTLHILHKGKAVYNEGETRAKRMVGINIDLSQEINKRENEVQLISEVISRQNHPSWIRNEKRKVISVNRAFREKLGYSIQDLSNSEEVNPFIDICMEDFQSKMSTLEKKGEMSFETDLIDKEKNRIPSRIHVHRIDLKGSNEVRYVAYAQDITAEHTLALKLHESEEWLSGFEDFSLVSKLIYDFKKDQLHLGSWLEAYINKADANFIRASDFEAYIHPNDVPVILKQVESAQSRRANIELTPFRLLKHQSNSVAWLSVVADVKYDDNGDPVQLAGFIKDVTKEQEFTQQIQSQNEKLKRIAWMQSHELRAPLSRLLSIAELMSDEGNLSEEQLGLLNHIKISAQEVDSIIRRINKNTEANQLTPQIITPLQEEVAVEILLVDDDPILNLVHKKRIDAMGWDKELASYKNGKEALDHLTANGQKDKIYVVFLDINMPVLNGWDFLEQASKLEDAGLNIVVYMLTSSIDSRDRKRAFKHNSVKDYFLKPLSKIDLTTVSQSSELELYFE